jgi:farnesyl-diphosphate farnesyltransferase
LRGLDTIEDDMTLSDEIKQPILRTFHLKLSVEGWTFDGCGPGEKDRQLLVEFDNVIKELNLLDPK